MTAPLRRLLLPLFLGWLLSSAATAPAEPPDLILHHGKIVTVDAGFRTAQAMAVRGERIVAVGPNHEVLELAGPATRRIDLAGKTVLPGLIDSHTHPLSAALHEFDHPVPEMETVADVLAYVRARAAVLGEGKWISIQQVFITRLRDRRFPARQELDGSAPRNPVIFRTGPDCSLNSMALKLCGIDKDFRISDGGPGTVERDPATGQPTGILRNCGRFIKFQSSAGSPTEEDRRRRLGELLAAYNRVGITSLCDRDAGESQIALYRRLKDSGRLTCRVFVHYAVDAQASWDQIEAGILRAARHPLHRYDNLLWVRGVKVYLDGGMLTGSAYMLEPWGVSTIYSIADPQYRGLLFIPADRLVKIVRLAMRHDLQPTAHTVGDGAVHALIAAYEEVNGEFPVALQRPCISHANFMTPAAVEKMHKLGIVADLQPVWLYLDGATLSAHFGDARLAWFQPYKALFARNVTVGGGSDHMQKIEPERSINRYNPFLGMWTTLARQPRWTDKPLHPEQAITRQQAIRLYTINNAYLTFEEKQKGSLEPGKLADFIVLDRDVLTCPLDQVKDVQVTATYLGGKPVYEGASP
jgi:predicted amidohydrolase YtcJ